MENQGVAVQKKEESTVEERINKLSIIMQKAKEGDPQAIKTLEEINRTLLQGEFVF